MTRKKRLIFYLEEVVRARNDLNLEAPPVPVDLGGHAEGALRVQALEKLNLET